MPTCWRAARWPAGQRSGSAGRAVRRTTSVAAAGSPHGFTQLEPATVFDPDHIRGANDGFG